MEVSSLALQLSTSQPRPNRPRGETGNLAHGLSRLGSENDPPSPSGHHGSFPGDAAAMARVCLSARHAKIAQRTAAAARPGFFGVWHTALEKGTPATTPDNQLSPSDAPAWLLVHLILPALGTGGYWTLTLQQTRGYRGTYTRTGTA